MLKHQDSLDKLANAYVKFIVHRDELIIKSFLSLDFVLRRKVTDHIKLIHNLPRLLYGVGIEAHLFEDYKIETVDGQLRINPFQFDVCYSPHTDLFSIEKITITINGVFLEDNQWKIGSIISDDERVILLNVIENLKEPAQV